MNIPIWGSMASKTRMTFIIVTGCVIIAAMVTGNFDSLVELWKETMAWVGSSLATL